ncbi:uncharacterized protein LOC144878329 [Branchiostoma floridae x Branchiostoma japonicum]
MSPFPYRSVRGLGALQVFLSVVSICLGVGDLVAGLSNWRGPGFGVFYISTGTWTGLSFLVAGSLAASIGEGRTAERKIGAILTMSLLNATLFSPGLVVMSVIGFVQSSYFRNGGYAVMFAQEITLTIVGCLEWILSIVTVTVCFRGDAYDQRAVNQVVPMSTKTSEISSQQPSRGYFERASLNTDGPSTSKQPGESNEVSERKVNNLAPEIGVRRTRKPSPINMEEKDTP